jgi:hypothetical protein
MPERGTSLPAAAPFDRCPSGITLREIDGQKGMYTSHFEASISTAPAADGGGATCCYAVCGPRQHRPVIGRPPRDGDDIAIAPAIASSAWLATDPPHTEEIPLEDALLEHASVAAFARLSLSLLAFGAPPDLVARAHEAALDEIRHAQISFANAGGGDIGPGPCPAFATLRAHPSLADLAEETYVDGCVGETIAALKLRLLAADATLLGMARDEERHAELAWRIIEWALSSGDASVRERVVLAAQRTSPRDDDALAFWAHENVIAPCTRFVLQAA